MKLDFVNLIIQKSTISTWQILLNWPNKNILAVYENMPEYEIYINFKLL